MANKQQRKENIKAKQRTMQDAKDAGGQAFERQTEGLNEVLRERGSGDSGARETSEAVKSAIASAKKGQEIDPRLLQLFKDFKMYRVIVIAFVVIGFAVLLISMGLTDMGVIDEDMQWNAIVMANIIIFAGLIISFARARPIREDINTWSKVNRLALEESNGLRGASQADIDKIFLTRARNKRVPPTPEFRSIRRVWFVLIGVAVALMIIAVLMAPKTLEDVTIPVVLVIISFVLLLIAAAVERIKMKPLREAYVKELDEKVKKANKAAKRSRRK